MCGRFVQTPIRDAASLGFPQLVGDMLSLPASYNLAPTQRAGVVLDRGEGLQVQRLAWGLLPFWAKAKGLQGSTINTRIETVATKPAFRSAFKARRCHTAPTTREICLSIPYPKRCKSPRDGDGRAGR